MKNARDLQKVDPEKMKNRRITEKAEKAEKAEKGQKSNVDINQVTYTNNNLNFNFEHKEQIIKDLEKQIQYERKLRVV